MRGFRVAAAALAAVWVYALLVVRDPPLPLLRLLGAEARRPIDVEGGLRAVYTLAGGDPAAVAKNLGERAAARGAPVAARVEDGRVVVEAAGVTAADLPRYDNLVARAGRLEMRLVVEGSAFARELAERTPGDPLAAELGVSVQPDSWYDESSSSEHRDFYLTARELRALERYLARAGLAPDQGTEVRYEPQVSRRLDGAGADAPRWRSYVVERRAVLTSADVADAQVMWDKMTNRPEVLVTFGAEGRRRFAEVTGASVGRKLAILVDDKISSAPVIMSAITGGRATITLGGGLDARGLLREAEDLAGALRAGPVPGGALSGSFEAVPPRVTRTQLVLARLVCALLAGLAAALVLGPSRRLAAAPRAAAALGRRPWGALLVTLVAPAVVVAGRWLPLPLVDLEALRNVNIDPTDRLGIFAIGLLPVLVAYIAVELAALVIPAWKARRDRREAATAALAAGLVLAQSYAIVAGLSRAELIAPGARSWAVVMLTLAAGTFCLVAIARLVTRHGLANGYSVLLLTAVLVEACRAAPPLVAQLAPARAIMVAAATAAIALATVWLLRARLGALRLPVSGAVPLVDGPTLLLLVPLLSLLGIDLPRPWLEAIDAVTPVHIAIQLGLVLAATCVLGWRFTWPGLLVSAGALVAMAGVAELTRWQAGALLAGAAAIAVATAAVMDLAAGWRAGTGRIAVWPLDRVQSADGALAALRAAGIDAALRDAHVRTLLQLFGPFVTIAVMVPPGQAAEAARLLEGSDA